MSSEILFLGFGGFVAFIYILAIIKITRSSETTVEQIGVVCPECRNPLEVFSPLFKPFALVCRNPECKLCWAGKKAIEENTKEGSK